MFSFFVCITLLPQRYSTWWQTARLPPMKTAEVVKSMAELLRGVPMTPNGPAVYGIITQIRGDWKWQRDTWCPIYCQFSFTDFVKKNSSWNCLHGVSWSCSFPIKCKILKYDHTEIVIHGQTVPNAIYLNTAQNVQSYIIEEWLNLSVGYNCNKVCHHCRVMTESSLQPPSQLVGRPLHTLQSFLAECIKHGPRSSSRTISISLNSMSLNFSQLWSLKKKHICRTMEKIKHHTMSPGHPYTMRSTMWSSCIFTPYDQMVCDAHTESWCRPLDLRKLHAKHSWRLWLVGRPGYYHQRWSPCPCIWKI